jgi:hypothetical protein
LADNIGHAIEAKNRAKGASAKQDRADLVFACSPTASPPGLIFRATKVRSMRSPVRRGDEWVIYRDMQRFAQHKSDGDVPAETFRPTTLMERVWKELGQAAEPLSKSEIRRRVSGRNEYIDKALDALVSDGNVEKTGAGYGSIMGRRTERSPRRRRVVNAGLTNDQLELLADLIADRLAARAGGELIDAETLAQRIGRSRAFV